MGLIGHNNGPTMEGGTSWRKHCWTVAREALLPTLPIEVVRGRVRRAKELGLDYRTYASVRAQTGHDVVAFLFSSNALRVRPLSPAIPEAAAQKLAAVIGAERIGLAVAPLSASALSTNAALDRAHAAPMCCCRSRRWRRRSARFWARRPATGWFWSATRRWSGTGARLAGLPPICRQTAILPPDQASNRS